MRFLLSAAVALASIAQVTAENWAVIAAGSNGYSNYRHQADACNAIKLLKAKGIPESNIITLLWDDIANNKANPFPGQIFNKPTDKGVPGEDVYAACHIDYKNPDVTADLFRAILEGNKDFVPKSGKKGKVLESTTNDRVFVFFVDHGATGLVAFPNTYLYADELVSTLEKSHANGKFKELVFYLEACEAGSMFTNLKEDIGVYATTASNAVESSWGTYCSPQDKVNGKSIGSCLGDLYSVNWLDDVWGADLNKETLEEDYITVRDKTTLSHVIQFGDLSEDTEVLKRFFASTSYVAPALRRHQNTVSDEVKILSAVESRNVRLHYLTAKYENAVTVEEKEAASVELQAEIAHRDAMDAVFSTSVRAVLNVHALTQLDQGLKVEATHFDCLRNVNKVVDQVCGRYSDYSLKYVKHVAYMCEQKVNQGMSETVAAEVIGAVIASQCANVLSL